MLIQHPRIPLGDILLYGWMPGFLKKFFYRLKGYRIGKGVSLGFGTVICGQEVTIGNYTSIGFFTIIRGKSIHIGAYVSIGSTTFLDTPYIDIGEGSKINEQVFVGGLQFPDSKFSMGRNCQIMQMAFLNPAKSITIGDDSGIGGFCQLFGHTSWQSQFEGYLVDFKPIEIGQSVSIAWGAFILPGVSIGDGAVVGAKSLVNQSIPPKSLAVGYPARVVAKYPEFPKAISDDQKACLLQAIVTEMINYFKGSGLICDERNHYILITKVFRRFGVTRTKRYRLQVFDQAIDFTKGEYISEKGDVIVSLRTIPLRWRQQWEAKNTMWIDIEAKQQSILRNDLGDEVVLYLRRYGVRFNRIRTERTG